MFDRINHPIVTKVYRGSNYFIEIDPNIDKKTACIYFSSNGLYYPNNLETFNEVVVEGDRYEWKKNKLFNIQKHIFVRDIFKQWYLKGINSKINSFDKLLNFFKKETEGYQVTTIGSSAGGYASTLFGKWLNANKIININGQYSLWHLLQSEYDRKENPVLVENQNNKDINQYYNISNILEMNAAPVFYFYSCLSNIDLEQFEKVKNSDKLFPIPIKTNIHGIPFWFENITDVLNLDINNLKRLIKSRGYSRLSFSITIAGYKSTMVYITKRWKHQYYIIKNHIGNFVRSITK
jgi:hypothetical protein